MNLNEVDELIQLVGVAKREKDRIEERLDDLADTLEMLQEKLEALELDES